MPSSHARVAALLELSLRYRCCYCGWHAESEFACMLSLSSVGVCTERAAFAPKVFPVIARPQVKLGGLVLAKTTSSSRLAGRTH
eukprot:11922943-Heterocapsa_arctica.AAC.2